MHKSFYKINVLHIFLTQINVEKLQCNDTFKPPICSGKCLFNLIQQIHSNGWFIQKRGNWLSLWMGHWIIDSLDSFKNVDSFSNKTPLCCSETLNSSAVALNGTIFVGKTEQKRSIFSLKSKSLNFNLLFIAILLYKISVTLQSGWYCYSGKHHGHLMMLT